MATVTHPIPETAHEAAMTRMTPSHPVEPLPELWRAWTQVLNRFASRGRSGPRLNPNEYRSIYQRIVTLCDAQTAIEQPDREFYRQLGETVRPWVTLQALQNADAELIANLYSHSATIDRELHGGRESWAEFVRRVGKPVLVAILIASVIGTGLFSGLFAWMGEVLENWWRLMRFWFVRRSTAELTLLAAAVVVAIGWGLVSRTRRS